MTKRIAWFGILAVAAVVLCAPAFAEVQNVKVGGSVEVLGIIQEDYDLHGGDSVTTYNSTAGLGSADTASYFASITTVKVGADLTDNVQTEIELLNQRDWNDPAVGGGDTSSEVITNLANVTLKEFFYSPLTLKIGRQNIWWGEGFIIGLKQRDPGAGLSADEFTGVNGFDAITATLDFEPWTISGVVSKIEEGTTKASGDVSTKDDVDLYGVNVGYRFTQYNAEAEAYWVALHDSAPGGANTGKDSTHTLGLRGSMEPIQNARLSAEGAIQFGDYFTSTADRFISERDRAGWALDLRGEYTFADISWKPKVGVEYVYYSGEETEDELNGIRDDDDFGGWNPIFRGKFHSAIREFHRIYYVPDMTSNDGANIDSGYTNEHQLIGDLEVKPLDDVTVVGRFLFYWFDEEPRSVLLFDGTNRVGNSDSEIGQELDIQATYDYTEDVTFKLITAWFIPGDFFDDPVNDNATEVVGSVKVAF